MTQRKMALITGATGFVGRHLCPELKKAGFNLRAVFTELKPSLHGLSEIEWIKLDSINRHTNWNLALQGGITHVIHLAAVAHRITPKDQVRDSVYDEVNHLGTARLAKAVAETQSVQRFIFMSSIGAVTNLSEGLVDESTDCHPDTAYGKSKLSAEKALQEIFRESRVEWCIFRSPLLYGPGNPGNMERLLKLLKLKVPLPLRSVRNRRSFLYVGNLVNALCLALEHPAAARKIFCISDGNEMSTADLLLGLGCASGRSVRLFPFPRWGLHLLGQIGSLLTRMSGHSFGFDAPAMEKLCGSLPVDSSLFRRTCGWKPPYTIEEGLQATVAQSVKLVSHSDWTGCV